MAQSRLIRVPLIVTTSYRGAGTKEDMGRQVREAWTAAGTLFVREDPGPGLPPDDPGRTVELGPGWRRLLEVAAVEGFGPIAHLSDEDLRAGRHLHRS